MIALGSRKLQSLVGNDKLYYSEVRGAAVDAFETIDSADDNSISIVELCLWLDGKLSRTSG